MEESCVIIAQGKTGSTGLFHSLLRTGFWPKDAYEPKKKVMSPDEKSILTKIVLEDYDLYDQSARSKTLHTLQRYSHKIILTRDPRDRLVSGICYRGYKHIQGHDRHATYYDLLEQKTHSPSSVSCLELAAKLKELSKDNFDLIEDARTGGTFLMEADIRMTNSCRFKYEDFIREDFSVLESYLGISDLSTASPEEMKTRTKAIRKKARGDWKDWFTDEDVEFFSKKDTFMLDYMGYFGYNKEVDDWSLNKKQIILPEHSFKYYKGLVGL